MTERAMPATYVVEVCIDGLWRQDGKFDERPVAEDAARKAFAAKGWPDAVRVTREMVDPETKRLDSTVIFRDSRVGPTMQEEFEAQVQKGRADALLNRRSEARSEARRRRRLRLAIPEPRRHLLPMIGLLVLCGGLVVAGVFALVGVHDLFWK